MSAIHPTHPPGLHPQDDRHFIGILPLTGYQSEDDYAQLPPLYAVSMHASGKEGAIENLHETLYDSNVKSALKWDTLITACDKAVIKLKASLVDLNQNWFKAHLLRAEKAVVQQQLEAGLAQVQLVHAAAQALCQEDTPANLLELEAALKGLEAVKPTVSTAQSSTTTPIQSERIQRWMQVIKNYLGPIALTGWGLIVQSGILSSDTAKRIPLVGGIIGLCLKIKENIDTCIAQAKTEDQAGLIQICNSLVEIFMEVDRIGKAVKERLAARRNAEESLEFIRDARKDFYSNIDRLDQFTREFGKDHKDQLSRIEQVENKLKDFDGRFTKFEENQKILITLLQKQSNLQHSTVDNAA